MKVWDIRDNSLKPVLSSYQAPVDQTDRSVTVKPRRVRCLTTTEETVYWGDDGVNIKAMELNSGTGNEHDAAYTVIRDFKIQDATASRTRWPIKNWD